MGTRCGQALLSNTAVELLEWKYLKLFFSLSFPFPYIVYAHTFPSGNICPSASSGLQAARSLIGGIMGQF